MTRQPSPLRAARDAAARARLTRAAAEDALPRPVLVRALARTGTPARARTAVDGYWAAHPLRADRLARALAGLTGAPPGWARRLGAAAGLPRDARVPPAPYREPAHRPGPGRCCLCGQPVFRFGWHRDLWGRGANLRATWHACCAAAWRFWTAPHRHGRLLGRLQRRRCAVTGDRLGRAAEVDHRLPLALVWRERRHDPWPAVLAFWGAPNLRVVNRAVHAEKTAAEASGRAAARARAPLPLPGRPLL